MGRTICKPRIRIDPAFTGERTIIDAFGEAYVRYFDHMERMDASGHTLVNPEIVNYTSDDFKKGGCDNEEGNGKENGIVLQTVKG